MNAWAHRLSAFSALAHLAAAIAGPPGTHKDSLPASWWAIYQRLPDPLDWLWTGLYVVTGVAAALGIWHPAALRFGFYGSAFVNFIWGWISVYGWVQQTGGTLPGSITYWLLSGTMAVLGRYVLVGEWIEAQVVKIGRSEVQNDGEP